MKEGKGGIRNCRREDEKRKEGWKEWKIGYCNIAGPDRKNNDYMRNLEQWEVVVMIETWLDERARRE